MSYGPDQNLLAGGQDQLTPDTLTWAIKTVTTPMWLRASEHTQCLMAMPTLGKADCNFELQSTVADGDDCIRYLDLWFELQPTC